MDDRIDISGNERPPAMSVPAVQMQGIIKTFNNTAALDQVNFELREGEIHALLGENGAGKSTLMKILRGIYTADSGQIKILGQTVKFNSPNDSRACGIAMVFQEFSLVPTLTVAQNIFLTRESRTRVGLIDDRECERRANALFKEMDVAIDPRLRVEQLSTGYRQLTEITSAISQDARILILDEPTASLTHTETMSLFNLMRKLKERGISIIYISHRMEEIFQIADRITVLRDGHNIITDDVENLTIHEVIEHIIGRKAETLERKVGQVLDFSQQPLLEVNHLSAKGVEDISLRLHPGEVIGLAGLMGSGRTELMQAIFGMNKIKSGEVIVRGKPVNIKSPEDSMQAGIALIPEDRRLQGLILAHSIKDNFVLPLIKLGRLSSNKMLVNDQKGDQLTANFITKLKIRSNSILKPVRLLSGGNQQKVVIAKWLSTEPDILLMDEPTAGVDIGTKSEILEIVRQLAKAGKGIIIISSELQELMAISDRILIVKKGQISQEVHQDDSLTEEKLHRILQGAETSV